MGGGSIIPTYGQLEKLADRFKVPIAVFFFPNPPELPPIEETFRTLPAEQFHQIPSRVKLLLRWPDWWGAICSRSVLFGGVRW